MNSQNCQRLDQETFRAPKARKTKRRAPKHGMIKGRTSKLMHVVSGSQASGSSAHSSISTQKPSWVRMRYPGGQSVHSKSPGVLMQSRRGGQASGSSAHSSMSRQPKGSSSAGTEVADVGCLGLLGGWMRARVWGRRWSWNHRVFVGESWGLG